MTKKEVHVGDDWYLDENNDGDLIVVNSNTGKVVKAIDKETGDEDKKGNSVNNLLSIKNAVTFIYPADSDSEIETKLSSSGKKVFTEGSYVFNDEINIGASDQRIIIKPGASLKLADAASPTSYTDDQGTDHVSLLHNSGYDNVYVISHGEIIANETNHLNPLPIWWDGRDGGTNGISGGGFYHDGIVTDARGLFWGSDCEGLYIPYLYNRGGKSAPLVLEGCEDSQIGTVITDPEGASDEGEAIDLNAYNKGINIGNIIGINTQNAADQLLDINESNDITIDSIYSQNHTTLLGCTPAGGGRLTDKTAPRTCNNVTVKSIKGHTSGRSIELNPLEQPIPMKNWSIKGINVQSDVTAINAAYTNDNQLDNLILKGRVHSNSASKYVCWLGNPSNGKNMYNLDINLIVTGNGYGPNFGNLSESQIKVIAKNLANNAFMLATEADVASEAKNNLVNVIQMGSGGDGVVINSNGGDCSENVIKGISKGSTGDDLTVSGSNNKIDVDYDTFNDTGTNNLEVQYA